jgi:ParB/RepB/Spo0J family partition protein
MIETVNVSDISLDFGNCREAAVTVADVADLAKDIARNGLINPITIRRRDGKCQLIAGHRRFIAITRVLHWTKVEARIVDVDDRDAALLQLSENIERKSLNVLDEARALDKLFPVSTHSAYDISEIIGRHQSWVLQRRALLKLPAEIQAMFASGRIPISRVSSVLNAPNQHAVAEALTRRKNPRSPMPGVKKRGRREVQVVIRKMLEAGIQGLAPRALAWSIGSVSDDDLDHEINETVRTGR